MSSLPWIEDQTVLGIDIYRSDDYLPVGRINLRQMLVAVFESILGLDLTTANFRLYFYPITDSRELNGSPSVINLRSSHGFLNVIIVSDKVLIYQHPHSVREVVARPLQRLLADHDPEEKHWGFGVSGPGLEKTALVRPAPQSIGAVNVSTGGDQPRLFRLEAMPDDPLPTHTMGDFGVTNVDSTDSAVDRIVLAPDVHEGFLRTMEFSDDVEDGGFLTGQVFQDDQRPGRRLIHIRRAIPAERTGASLLAFTFTGESFLRINDAVARSDADERLIGWYHTHLFAATDSFGLSSIDVELHTRTFLRGWHIAGLLNIANSTRQLRFYAWDGTAMVQIPFWIGEL